MITNERKHEIVKGLYAYAKVQQDRLLDIAKLKNAGIQLDNHVSLQFYKREFTEYFELSEEEYQWIEESEYIVKAGDYFVLHYERLMTALESLGRLCIEDEQRANIRKHELFALLLLIIAFIVMCL